MRIAVIGSRTFNDYDLVKHILGRFTHAITLIVSGGADGADTLGERFASENFIKKLIFKPDWEKYGKSAGFERNKQIIDNADMVVAFWDKKSKGTAHSIELAERKGIQTIVIPV